MKGLRLFIRTVDTISDLVGRGISVVLPAMVLVLTYEVVARYVFEKPTLWAFDMSIFMFGYCGLLSGAYVLRKRQHINVDILFERLPPRAKAATELVTGLLFFFFIALVVIYGWEEAYVAIKNGYHSPTEWGPPVGHFKLMIPVGAFLLLLQGLANWLRSLYMVVAGKELEP